MEIKTIIRILKKVKDSPLRKRTELATACNMSYGQFIRYADKLVSFELLIMYSIEKTKIVKITPLGIRVLKRLLKN